MRGIVIGGPPWPGRHVGAGRETGGHPWPSAMQVKPRPVGQTLVVHPHDRAPGRAPVADWRWRR